MRSMSAVRGSCSSVEAIGSAKVKRIPLHSRDRGRETLMPRTSGRRDGCLSLADCSATSFDMAV